MLSRVEAFREIWSNASPELKLIIRDVLEEIAISRGLRQPSKCR